MTFEAFSPETLLGPLDDVERKHVPERLYLAGDASLVRYGVRVSVIGSRKASELGIARAQKLATMLAERGVIVVSGLAEGIDTAAHTAAIDANGKTVAVLGTPLDRFFPAKNRELQQLIMREHLAVSQFAPGKPLGARAFPMRNRTMALLSDASVIIEAAGKSGTIHQGWEALRLGRELYVLASLVDDGLPWVNEMLHHGAKVLSDQTTDSFFESLPKESRVERADVSF